MSSFVVKLRMLAQIEQKGRQPLRRILLSERHDSPLRLPKIERNPVQKCGLYLWLPPHQVVERSPRNSIKGRWPDRFARMT
jgi:hypothetical protein